MIEDDRIASVEVNSTWDTELGEGCELAVALESGREMFVIRTGLPSSDDEIETWREDHVGKRIAETEEITTIALETGGQQTTLEVTLDDGFGFEADLLQEAERTEKGTEDLETEWTFEGRPGVEMGEQETDEDGS